MAPRFCPIFRARKKYMHLYEEEYRMSTSEHRDIRVFTLLSGGEMQENEYQEYLVKKIYEIFERFGARRLVDVIVNINDANYIQGIPDLTVFYRPTARYAMLEVKLSARSKEQPNQRWYIETWGETAFAAFIHPQNEEEVLDALQQALRA